VIYQYGKLSHKPHSGLCLCNADTPNKRYEAARVLGAVSWCRFGVNFPLKPLSVKGAWDTQGVPSGNVGVVSSSAYGTMAQKVLDVACVRAVFQKVGCKGVP
jgi:hypothetical protein